MTDVVGVTDVIEMPLALGSLVDVLRGPHVGRQALVVDRQVVPAGPTAAGRKNWQYTLWIDEPGHEVVVRRDEIGESKSGGKR